MLDTITGSLKHLRNNEVKTLAGLIKSMENRVRYNEYRNLLNEFDRLYKEIGNEDDPCIYCGVKSTVWDHIPALRTIDAMDSKEIKTAKPRKVRSCQKCNDTLIDSPILSIPERKDLLLRRYIELRDDLNHRLHNMTKTNSWME